jgi:hypothetical protein
MAAIHLQSLSHPRTLPGDDFHPPFPQQQQPFTVSLGKPGGSNPKLFSVSQIVQKIAEDCSQRNELQSCPSDFLIWAFPEDCQDIPLLELKSVARDSTSGSSFTCVPSSAPI